MNGRVQVPNLSRGATGTGSGDTGARHRPEPPPTDMMQTRKAHSGASSEGD
jgi:hypothetical protein